MITDAGFEVEGIEQQTLPELHRTEVRLRQRGAGTDKAANA